MKRMALPLIVALSTASPAASQSRRVTDLSKASLEDLLNVTITTASLAPEGAAGAPARVQVVSADQVRRRGYRSLADLLQDLSDFKVDLRGDQDYTSQIVVQGSRGADRVIVLLDGVRISSPTNEPLPILANYPVHAARQVEILYGPASALYGADAFSAVINIISRDASDGTGVRATTTAGQFGLFDGSGTFTGRIRGASVMIAGQAQYDRQPDLSRYYPGDLGDLRGQRTGTFETVFGPMAAASPTAPGYASPALGRSVQATVKAGGWQFLGFGSQVQASTSPSYTPDNAVYNAGIFNLNTLLVGSISHIRPIGPLVSTTAVTYSRHELDPESGYMNVYSNMSRSYKYAFGSMLKLEQQAVWRPSPTMGATVGATAERFFAIPQGADLNAPIVSRNAPGTILNTTIVDPFHKVRYANTGVFAQAQYAPRPTVSATLGGRVDYNTRYGVTVNPRAGLVFTPATGTTVKLLAGRAYLAPSPYQSYAHYGSFASSDGGATYTSRYWHLGNAALKPQRKRTFEASLAQTIAPGTKLSVWGFYSRFSNLIKEADGDRAYAGHYLGWPVDYIDFPVNEGRARLFGGSAALDYLRAFGASRRVSASAAISFADGRVWEHDRAESSASLAIGAMAPVQARLTADVDWGRWSLAPRILVTGRQRLIATDEAGSRRTLPAYARADIHVLRTISPSLSAFVGIENAFDARYRHINARAYLNPEELVGAPQNPRRVSAGVTVTLGGRE